MDATEIAENFEELTHVYFTFAGITADYDVNISDDVKKQFEIFDKMDAPFKKILSFGGWAESTDAATFQRYRDVHSSFDGVDIDWEYPGATDQGIPAGDRTDGLYYYPFLSVLRNLLPSSKSLSIALPGSYWYLNPFPVDQMAEVLDYFVFMTYDLHGQWDYGNKFANPGCDNGNCLRSHINRTETRTSLSMITKAGVPAEKVIVGIASYGRSFRMADNSCTGPDCLFTGSFEESEAEPGQCTGTGGYILNAEINEIWQLTCCYLRRLGLVNSFSVRDGAAGVPSWNSSLTWHGRSASHANYTLGVGPLKQGGSQTEMDDCVVFINHIFDAMPNWYKTLSLGVL
ncbi:hypothetical protein FGSG_04648 [Fusarium graminearum PH-1]|nr:hypothetical protein FGSG_04648 [Fusarium graminearum PH-1]ESU08424.1 hypothetical protein FGSG_04648 [Fusarium graminearum PH-1]|eukprot:XP_011320923.1 hypothetical protein FGSG_04648 [Fusarium graminearum PH-1]